MRVLVVNAGSSSLKLAVLDGAGADLAVLGSRSVDTVGEVGEVGETDTAPAIAAFADEFGHLDAVGHRVVHGGERHTGPVVIDAAVRAELGGLVELAPLHQPAALAGIDAITRALPEVPQVACFDTAFHTTIPRAAATYALPAAWRDRFGLRRYGFHGLSHAYATRRAAELTGRQPARLVSCHLGAGASLAAVRDGRCVDTTMGFTPLAGLVMNTRSGDVDPGMLVWLLRANRVSLDELDDGLEHRSGLAGLSGTSGDIREVHARADAGDAAARLALDVYAHRLRRELAAMTAALGGLDTLVFTGGVGEHAQRLRAAALAGLGYLGVVLDEARNATATGDARIGAAGAPVDTLVITAREDLEIAHQVAAVV
jgi:acetate kinase